MWKLNKVSTPGPQNRACAAEHSTPAVCVPPLVAQCNIKSGIDTLKIEVILRGHTRCKGRGSHSSAYRATGVAAPARNLSTGSNSSKDEILRCRRTWTLPENWVVMPQAQVPRHAGWRKLENEIWANAPQQSFFSKWGGCNPSKFH